MSSVSDDPIGVPSMLSIRGKVALVTSGSRGTGLMIARGLVEADATVYISSRSVEACDAVAAELSTTGRCASLPNDLSGLEGVSALTRDLGEREEKLHILVREPVSGAAMPRSQLLNNTCGSMHVEPFGFGATEPILVTNVTAIS